MVEQLSQEAEQEACPASQERKYLRLGRDGKVFYISGTEAMEEEVLAGPHKKLSDEEILVAEWNNRVDAANQLKERISLIHHMMRDNNQRPSHYELAYNTLWSEYGDAIEGLRELDPESVDRFGSRVAAKIVEIKARLDNLCDDWDPDYLDYFERTLACYEKNYDLLVALQPRQPVALALRCTEVQR